MGLNALECVDSQEDQQVVIEQWLSESNSFTSVFVNEFGA